METFRFTSILYLISFALHAKCAIMSAVAQMGGKLSV